MESPLHLLMALDALLCGCLEVEHLLELGPMGAVAATAPQGKIFVARITYLFADGMGRMLSPVMAAGAQLKVIVLFCQEQIVGRVRIMAVRAAPFHHRFVFGKILGLPFHCVGVATPAECAGWFA